MMRLGESHAIGKCDVHVVRACEKNLPAVLRELGFEPACQIESEFLFRPAVENADGAGLVAAVARVYHHNAIRAGKIQRGTGKQRFHVFLQVEAVNENLVVNELRREAQMKFYSTPCRFAAANFENECAVF